MLVSKSRKSAHKSPIKKIASLVTLGIRILPSSPCVGEWVKFLAFKNLTKTQGMMWGGLGQGSPSLSPGLCGQGSCWAQAGLHLEMLGAQRSGGEPPAPLRRRAELCQRLPDHLPSSPRQRCNSKCVSEPTFTAWCSPSRWSCSEVSDAVAQSLRPNCSSFLPPRPRPQS